jgi:hypothetical protein
MNPDLDRFLDEFLPRYPRARRALLPRRIVPPAGFLNPRYYAVTLYSSLWAGMHPRLCASNTHITGALDALLHLEYGVPTYFVRSEFAQAVAQTDPPEDFLLDEIKWPMPAMLFVLPVDFALKHFGCLIPFLSVTRAEAGNYPDRLKHLPETEMPLAALQPVLNEVPRLNMVYPAYSQTDMPVLYTGTYPLRMNIRDMAGAPFEDATYLAEAVFDVPLAGPAAGLPVGEKEQALMLQAQAFAVKLMLALTAEPAHIQAGGLTRKARAKHGHVREELWSPNLIGWAWRAARPEPGTAGPGSTHASPRMHWRRGHFANLAHGPGRALRRLFWRQPCLVNAQSGGPTT